MTIAWNRGAGSGHLKCKRTIAMHEGTSALKLEDPRLPMMMAPVTDKRAPEVLLRESWLRQEAPMNMSEEARSRAASTMAGPNTWASCSMGM